MAYVAATLWLGKPLSDIVCGSSGLIVVMPLAGTTASQEEMDERYPKEFHLITSEGKPDDYRWLHGRLVVVDYGLQCERDVCRRRAYYREELVRTGSRLLMQGGES